MTQRPERLTLDDLPGLVALEREGQSHPWSEALLHEAFVDERAQVWGLKMTDGLKGFAVFYRLPFDAELQAITVAPRMRRQGFATTLLETGIAQANAWGSERLLLEVRASNQAAIDMYRRAGFLRDGVRRGYYDSKEGREDAWLMSLRLAAGKA
ncbi:ribosomal protein S18-alanine N-acetyltransferase [Modicisalibacter luteus]|uniref:[Ribosomal protein bS18]-alanine N-acetyltransferase n=1 Tax=Modicisalibacter luteus TaxID=453962 RepID=A0ABV7LW05_9GAMM|nr:ribosomal protein S18-alanine N-acetyltransferase [Halomonas lutea]